MSSEQEQNAILTLVSQIMQMTALVSLADVEEILRKARIQEEMLPFLDPTRWMREGKEMNFSFRMLEAFMSFRRSLGDFHLEATEIALHRHAGFPK